MVVYIFTLLWAPFAPKLVNCSQHSESLNIRKNCEISDIFLRWQRFVDFQTYFKDSLCLEKLTDLGAKGAKRSVKMLTTNFYKSFFKNILLYMNGWLSKIRSVHTYVIPRTVYFGWICIRTQKLFFNLLNQSPWSKAKSFVSRYVVQKTFHSSELLFYEIQANLIKRLWRNQLIMKGGREE